MTIRINIASVFVDDQQKAQDFYTNVLGFETKQDVPIGKHRWLTVGTPGIDTVELLLEPSDHHAVAPFKAAVRDDGIPFTSFAVDDIDAEVARMKEAGAVFAQDVIDMGPVKTAIVDDTCGNLVQLTQAN